MKILFIITLLTLGACSTTSPLLSIQGNTADNMTEATVNGILDLCLPHGGHLTSKIWSNSGPGTYNNPQYLLECSDGTTLSGTY